MEDTAGLVRFGFFGSLEFRTSNRFNPRTQAASHATCKGDREQMWCVLRLGVRSGEINIKEAVLSTTPELFSLRAASESAVPESGFDGYLGCW